MNKHKIHFHTFDAFRFISFFIVFLNHIPIPDSSFLSYFSHSGGIGVAFFFVLSGFLITYILLNEKLNTDKISLPNFFLRRILRIWPLFYAMLLLAYLTPCILNFLHLSSSSEGYKPNWLMSLLFLENYKMIITNDFPNVSPLRVMWSLCIEEHFYIIWGILLTYLPCKRIPVLIGTSILIANITRWFFLQHGLPTLELFSNIDYFAFGAIPAFIFIYKKQLITKLESTAGFVKYIVAVLAVILVFVLPQIPGKWMPLLYPSILGILFSSLIMFTLPQNNGLKLKDELWISKLGLYTYGLYLFHTIVINLFSHIFTSAFEFNWLLISILSLVVTIALSALSYHFFEKQFLKLKVHFYTE